MKNKKTSRKKTFIGYVNAAQWDVDHGVRAISIEADGDEYIVENERLLEELSDSLDEEIEVTGIVTENGDGTKYIKVISYELLESYEDFNTFMN